MGGGLPVLKRRIEETDGSSFSLFDAHHFPGPHKALVNILPFPQTRLNCGFGIRRVALKPELPVSSKIFFGHISVKKFDAIVDNRALHLLPSYFHGSDKTFARSRPGSQLSLSLRNPYLSLRGSKN